MPTYEIECTRENGIRTTIEAAGANASIAAAAVPPHLKLVRVLGVKADGSRPIPVPADEGPREISDAESLRRLLDAVMRIEPYVTAIERHLSFISRRLHRISMPIAIGVIGGLFLWAILAGGLFLLIEAAISAASGR